MNESGRRASELAVRAPPGSWAGTQATAARAGRDTSDRQRPDSRAGHRVLACGRSRVCCEPRLLAAFAMLLSVALASTAGASDLKTTPGSACVAADGALQGDLDYGSGRVINNGTGGLYVICPVVSEDPADTDGMIDFDVRVSDGSASDQVTCTLYSANNAGDQDLDTSTQSGVAFTGNISLDFDAVTGLQYGAWSMRCWLPPGSRVRWYTQNEDMTNTVAVDTKVVGGDVCIPEDDAETGFSYVTGLVYSSTTNSTRAVVCPLVRDNTATTTGLTGMVAKVYAFAGTTITCTGYSRDEDSVGVRSVAYSVEAGGQGTTGTLTWDSDDLSESTSPGYYYVRCEFSGGSGAGTGYIDSIRHTEDD